MTDYKALYEKQQEENKRLKEENDKLKEDNQEHYDTRKHMAGVYEGIISERNEEIKQLKQDLEEEQDDIIENYFANMKLRETTWKEWERMEEENKHWKSICLRWQEKADFNLTDSEEEEESEEEDEDEE